MIESRVNQKGKKTEDWLRKITRGDISGELSKIGQEGVRALADATPEETGLRSTYWGYRIKRRRNGWGIEWYNTDRTPSGTPIVILIQYGHATGNGVYIPGRDFINPTMRPIFDKVANDLWKKVRNG